MDAVFLKPTIADIDVLAVFLVFQIAVAMSECVRRRIILIPYRPSIGQSSGGTVFSGQDIGKCVSSLGSRLTIEQHGVDPRLIQARQVDYAAAVQYQDQLFIMGRKLFQTLLFHIGE